MLYVVIAFACAVMVGGSIRALWGPTVYYEAPVWSFGAVALAFFGSWAGFYFAAPAFNELFWAVVWGCVTLVGVIGIALVFFEPVGFEWVIPALIYLLIGIGPIVGTTSTIFRARDYAGLMGRMPTRNWTVDTQPANPAHVRLVPRETAHWMAMQQLGSAPDAIGSRFEIKDENIRLQMIRGKLWWIVPLDFASVLIWWSSPVSPGYIMVDAEDPQARPQLQLGHRLRYTPSAGFGYDLERHLRLNGYATRGFEGMVLEIDEQDRPWWVVSVYELAIGASGKRVTGVVIVDPDNGDARYYGLNQVPAWVDRTVPREIVEENLDNYGSFAGGWWNSWVGRVNLTESGTPRFIFGTDGQPYWVSEITSTNDNDTSMLGLVYTNARTGRSHHYRVTGGTEEAILARVNNVVSFRKQHGVDPTFYHIRGTMAAIVPLLGESHTFQGVAIARVDNLQEQVAQGDTAVAAIRDYESRLAAVGARMGTIDAAAASMRVMGRVQRLAMELRPNGQVYYLLLEGNQTLFSGTPELSPELLVTRDGDEVTIWFAPTSQGIVPLSSFDNRTITVRP